MKNRLVFLNVHLISGQQLWAVVTGKVGQDGKTRVSTKVVDDMVEELTKGRPYSKYSIN